MAWAAAPAHIYRLHIEHPIINSKEPLPENGVSLAYAQIPDREKQTRGWVLQYPERFRVLEDNKRYLHLNGYSFVFNTREVEDKQDSRTITFKTGDALKLWSFYTNILNWGRETSRSDTEIRKSYLVKDLYETFTIEFVFQTVKDFKPEDSGISAVAITSADDMMAIERRLWLHRKVTPGFTYDFGGRTYTFKDPDGHSVKLTHH